MDLRHQLAGLLLVVAIGPDAVCFGQSDQTRPEPQYVIQANDLLEIFVWREPELSRKVLVRPDGRISVPLVQDIQAAGLTPVQLRDAIEVRLKDFIASPSVTVIVDGIQHYRIYVTGKVNNPSSFMLEKPITVLQALSLAGGFQEYANESDIKIVRTYGDEYVYLDFNYKDVIKGKNTRQNIFLNSGDVVVVP